LQVALGQEGIEQQAVGRKSEAYSATYSLARSPATFTYDANGNLKSDDARACARDAEHRLIGIAGSNSGGADVRLHL
jgi:hypothetical protein